MRDPTKDNFVGHLVGVLNRVLWMMESNVTPLFVFDGESPALKRFAESKRQCRREVARDKLAALLATPGPHDRKLVSSLRAHSTKFPAQHSQRCMEMLQLCGIPVFQAPGEGEAQCAEFARSGLAAGVVTEDSDCLPFGASLMLRHCKPGSASIMSIDREKFIEETGLSGDEFTDLCILLGCDFTGRIAGLGPAGAYNAIQEYRTLENVMDYAHQRKDLMVSDELKTNFQEVRSLYRTPDVIPSERISCFSPTIPNLREVERWLVAENVFRILNLRETLSRFEACMEHHVETAAVVQL